jgi:acylphosphatase
VQGVFFRESTRQEAVALGLSGWVRNHADGCVECCFIGPRDSCEKGRSRSRASVRRRQA